MLRCWLCLWLLGSLLYGADCFRAFSPRLLDSKIGSFVCRWSNPFLRGSTPQLRGAADTRRLRSSRLRYLKGLNGLRSCGGAEGAEGAEEAEGSAEGLSDWRTFRAQLIKNEQKENKEKESDYSNPVESEWAHIISGPESGCTLLANPALFEDSQSYFKNAAIFLVEHDEDGTLGFIMNRPTPYKVGDIAPGLEVFKDCHLLFGGPVGDGIQVLHRVPDIPESQTIIDGLYYGGDLEHAADAVRNGKAKLNDFRFFYKYSSWAPNQLDDELETAVWFPAACSCDLLFKPSGAAFVHTQTNDEVWHSILESMGSDYEEISRAARDQTLSAPQPFTCGWEQILRNGSLVDGSVFIARMANPSVSTASVNMEIDSVVHSIRKNLGGRSSSLSILRAINEVHRSHLIEYACNYLEVSLDQVLYDDMGMHGNEEDYHNPKNSYIDQVLERRTGNPITLSVLYMSLAKRLGLHLSGINSPGHFLMRAEGELDEDGHLSEPLYIDAFDRGRVRTTRETLDFLSERVGMAASLSALPDEEDATESEIENLLPKTTPLRLYSRMLHNLVHACLTKGNQEAAKTYGEALEALETAARNLYSPIPYDP